MTDTTETTTPVPAPVVAAKTGVEATEPARVTGAAVAVVQAVFALLTTLGITYEADLPRTITALIVALVTLGALLFPLVQSEIIRGKVWSSASVATLTDAPAAEEKPAA